MTAVFVHGAGCSQAVFAAQIAAFPESSALDLPGHFCAGEPASIGELSDFICGTFAHCDPDTVGLCGHSMGAAVALDIALRRPPWLTALVVLGAGARLRVAPAILNGLETDFERTASELAEQYYFANAKPAWVDARLEEMRALGPQVSRDFQACNAFDVLERLGEISIPLLAITGEYDKMTPPKYAAALADRVPGGQARIVPGAGHFVMVERPEETNAAIRSFLTGIV